MDPNKKKYSKKIVAIDSWTGGAFLYEPLVRELNKFNIEIILIHFGSWGHDTGRPKEEYIGDLLVRDFSFYNANIEAILEIEKPDLVLFTSTKSLTHMIVNRICKINRIPTVHMMNGVMGVLVDNREAFERNFIQMLNLFKKRLITNVYNIIPFCFLILLKSKASLKIWLDYLRFIYFQIFGIGNSYYFDTTTKYGIVYSNYDRKLFARNYKISVNNIFIIGNPDWDRFRNLNVDYTIREIVSDKRFIGSGDVVYIDTALSKSGIVFANDQDFLNHIITLDKALKNIGYRLLLKMHPAHKRSNLQHLLNVSGINTVDDSNFLGAALNSSFVLVEPSSLAVLPAFLGVPIGLVKFGKLNNQHYGRTLTSYPRAFDVTDLGKIQDAYLNILNTDNWENTKNWIENNHYRIPQKSTFMAAAILKECIDADYSLNESM
jgi:hypothetical protein